MQNEASQPLKAEFHRFPLHELEAEVRMEVGGYQGLGRREEGSVV